MEYLQQLNVKILFEGKNPKPIEISNLPPVFSDIGWFQLFLYKKEWGELKDKSLSVYLHSLPIIEFRRTIIRTDEREISAGRIWYQNTYFDEDKNLVEKCNEIELFYNELKKKIKKSYQITKDLTPEKIKLYIVAVP